MKTALITGGSSGLGFAFAEQLGSQGYQIIILARNKERIDNAIQILIKKNIVAKGISCDITQEIELITAFEQIKKDYGFIDFLILDAGVVTTKVLCEFTSVSDLRKDLDVDLWGTIQSAYFFLPLLYKGSRILMISSGFGIMGAAGYSIYCAAKAGVVNFGEALRRELLYKKINVYVACTGDIDTPQYQNEIKNQPEWMKIKTPRKVLPPSLVARKILNKCKGNTKFLILIGFDVKFLAIVTRLLPRTLRDFLLDIIMPRPKL